MDVLDQFRRYTPEEFGDMLDRRRPPLIAPALAAMIVAALPKEGEVKRLRASDQRKLESAAAVLRWHGRERTYLFKVVDSTQARVGLHARFIVLVTHTALRLLSPAQLQALVAHEIGHEYVWDEYETARNNQNWHQVRALELFCDGLAMVTLAQIGADPATLMQGLKLLDASDRRNGLAGDDTSHPTLAERGEFGRRIVNWLKAGRRFRHAAPSPPPAGQCDLQQR